ncbi:MAG TPA: hypothetical protein VJM49_22150, partial [Acidimicrobiales bacterium]|nr:hypothetical protein [Acidimicrobiales bacterium]
MCAACVAQGVVYAGGALAGLQVMAARARGRRPSSATAPRGDTAAAPGAGSGTELTVVAPED